MNELIYKDLYFLDGKCIKSVLKEEVSPIRIIMVYQILKPLLFKTDPEKIHQVSIKIGKILTKTPIKYLLRKHAQAQDKKLEQIIHEIHFKNPVGLGAGFDKEAELIGLMGYLGFGFEEVGSITGEPCAG